MFVEKIGVYVFEWLKCRWILCKQVLQQTVKKIKYKHCSCHNMIFPTFSIISYNSKTNQLINFKKVEWNHKNFIHVGSFNNIQHTL